MVVVKDQGGNKHSKFKGYGDITGKYWYAVSKGALRRNLEFNITIEQAWELFIKQDRKCAISRSRLGDGFYANSIIRQKRLFKRIYYRQYTMAS